MRSAERGIWSDKREIGFAKWTMCAKWEIRSLKLEIGIRCANKKWVKQNEN